MTTSPGVQVFVGPANQLEIGTVTKDVAPAATLETVSDRLQRLNLVLPKGDKGDKGDPSNVPGPAGGINAWAPNTGYAAGFKVIAPNGDVVAATTAFTSGATYNAANWTPSTQDGRIGSLETGKWAKPADTVKTSMDDYTTVGKYPVTKSGVANRPLAAAGEAEVFDIGGIITQKWTTTEPLARIFTRSRTGGVWSAWATATWRSGALSSTASLDDYTLPGTYEVPNSGTLKKPTGAVGKFDVYVVGNTVTQEFLTLEATQRKFARQRVAGVWSVWAPMSWYQGILVAGTDLDTLVQPAEHSVTFLDHPNQPVAKGGSLTVKASSGDVVQEFTPVGDNPDEYRRRKPGGTGAWTAWKIRAFSTSSTPGGATSAGPGDPTRAPLGTWTPTLTAVDSSAYIAEFNLDRTVGFNANHGGGRLQETRDGGLTWTDLKVFPKSFLWVKQLGNGELLACTNIDPDPRDLWLSAGYGTGSVTWTKVLSAHSAYATFTESWSLSTYKNMIFAAEYGPKLPTWNGATIAPGENARYVYMSLDYGKTWSTVFDLNTYLLDVQGRATPTANHVHGVTWDPYWDRIWVTFGDDTNGILYSDDLGQTWETAFYGAVNNDPYQVVGIIAMPKAVLFGTDVAPNGVQRIDRAQGKHAGAYPIEQAYTIPGDNGTARTHLCHAIHKVEREGDDGPVLFGFSAETVAAASFIVATYDGFNFKLLWQDSVQQPAGLGLRTIAGPNLRGELIVGSNDARVANKWSRLTGPVPIY